MMVVNSKQLKIAQRYAQALCDLTDREIVLNELKQIIDFNTPVVVLTISRNERNRFIYERPARI